MVMQTASVTLPVRSSPFLSNRFFVYAWSHVRHRLRFQSGRILRFFFKKKKKKEKRKRKEKILSIFPVILPAQGPIHGLGFSAGSGRCFSRARARVCVCVCVCVRTHSHTVCKNLRTRRTIGIPCPKHSFPNPHFHPSPTPPPQKSGPFCAKPRAVPNTRGITEACTLFSRKPLNVFHEPVS